MLRSLNIGRTTGNDKKNAIVSEGTKLTVTSQAIDLTWISRLGILNVHIPNWLMTRAV